MGCFLIPRLSGPTKAFVNQTRRPGAGFQPVMDYGMEKTPNICLVIFMVGALAACTAPNPTTPAGQAEIAGQKCTLCILENPGDGAPCYAICMQKEEDQAAYQKAYGP